MEVRSCVLTVVFLLALFASSQESCVPRSFGYDSVACLCSQESCELLGKVERPSSGSAAVYESSKSGKRFESHEVKFSNEFENDEGLLLEYQKPSETQKEILGFGGAFTDSTGYNINKLSEDMKQKLLSSYFAEEGLNYNMGRVPLGCSDFSLRKYTYDEAVGDLALVNFNLAIDDFEFKIPIIQAAKKIQKEDIFLFTSPWTAPAWMKRNFDNAAIENLLVGEPGEPYYKAFANYFVKFFQAYAKQGIDFWGLTCINEPIEGLTQDYTFICLGLSAAQERDFIKMDLAPALRANNLSDINIMILDENRYGVQNYTDVILGDEEAAQYVAGTGVHWYGDSSAPPTVFDETIEKYPDKFILATEACAGWNASADSRVALGDWTRGEEYIHSIIEDTQHSMSGWIDWNMVLDLQGGPSWVNNFVDAPVIVNTTSNSFYFQPTYYALAHFSKFVSRGSKRASWTNQDGIEAVSFERPDSGVVFVLFNSNNVPKNYTIKDSRIGFFHSTIEARTIQTILYYPNTD